MTLLQTKLNACNWNKDIVCSDQVYGLAIILVTEFAVSRSKVRGHVHSYFSHNVYKTKINFHKAIKLGKTINDI